jgi:hypothetical protein
MSSMKDPFQRSCERDPRLMEFALCNSHHCIHKNGNGETASASAKGACVISNDCGAE